MATNPQTRRALIDQIPTEEGRTAPAAKPVDGIHSTEVGRQVYNTAMALPGVGGVAKAASTGGLISRAFNATARTANGASRGTAALAAVPAGMATAQAAETQQPKSETLSPSTAGAGRGYINPPLVSPARSQLQGEGAQSQDGQIQFDANTNTYSGTNVGAGAKIVGGRGMGSVSAQNMQAADELAANQNLDSVTRIATSGNYPAVPQRGMLATPTVAHSGNDWTARENLRRAKMDASSLIHRSHWAPKDSAKNAQAAYQQELKADAAAQGQQVDAALQTMKSNADLNLEGMRQEGADRRDGRRSLIDAARLGMEQVTQGFANRAAGQQEQLRNTLLDPNATPEQRALAQRSLAALAGKSAADRMQTVNLPDTVNDMGTVVRGGQALVRVLDDGTVQQVPVGAQGATRTPPAAAIADLQKNPASAAQFDAVFGAGASKQYLRR